jgi:hypothetical protein
VIHFHDVFWPFEYPEQWIHGGRAWNENYILKAFLQFNASFKVLFFNSYIATHHGTPRNGTCAVHEEPGRQPLH